MFPVAETLLVATTLAADTLPVTDTVPNDPVELPPVPPTTKLAPVSVVRVMAVALAVMVAPSR